MHVLSIHTYVTQTHSHALLATHVARYTRIHTITPTYTRLLTGILDTPPKVTPKHTALVSRDEKADTTRRTKQADN